MKNRVSWTQNGSTYQRVEGNISNVDVIPVGVYNIGLTRTGWYLEKTADKFTFEYKVYGIQSDFINHVLKAYSSTTGNLGILLNGVRGSGKTATAKILANSLNLPVIVVKSFGDQNQELIEFLSSFNFDCVLFFDEFEKQFPPEESSILQIMDGVYTSNFRKVFLLTTNTTHINENMISRPSRLRYIHEFRNLEESIIREYLNDTLKDKTKIEEIIGFVDTLEISTIDILKSIVEEINIFGYEEFVQTKKFFNIKTATYNYKCVFNTFTAEERDSGEFTISNYLADVKLFLNRKRRNSFSMESDYYNYLTELSAKYTCGTPEEINVTDISKSFKSLKVGDSFNGSGYSTDEFIVFIDKETNIVITQEKGDKKWYSVYYIINPNSRPSIYTSLPPNIEFVL